MERRLNKKTDEYFREFKNNIKNKVSQIQSVGPNESVVELLQFIVDYENLSFTKDDLIKRKRVKNMVPGLDRCCAKRANNEQCTRRKKDGNEYCGTHIKGIPHGIVTLNQELKQNTKQIEVYAQDISGIIYYIDKMGNVYSPEDVIVDKVNPRIIARYKKVGDKYSIPEWNI